MKMHRTTYRGYRIPDIINNYSEDNYTQIPNETLRNPDLSAKAKGLLCLLLSNRDGWYSYLATIQSMMADGRTSIQSGLRELEENGYLRRVQYRNKETKKFCGLSWLYTAIANDFDMERLEQTLNKAGLESIEKPESGNPSTGNPVDGKPPVNKTNYKKTNRKRQMKIGEKNNTDFQLELEGLQMSNSEPRITQSMFDKFWALYPKKVDKGPAKTAWDKLCRQTSSKRPAWTTIKTAILAQRKSERWSDPQFIPHPTRWIKQQRWLDDPNEMRLFHSGPTPKKKTNLQKELGPLESAFRNECLDLAEDIFPDTDITGPLVHFYKTILQEQDKHRRPKTESLFPSPISLLGEYLTWIDNNDWISSRTIGMLDLSNTLFKRFCREYAQRQDRDPLTGWSIHQD